MRFISLDASRLTRGEDGVRRNGEGSMTTNRAASLRVSAAAGFPK